MLTSGRALMLLLQEQETTSRMAAKSIFAGSFYIELAACKTLESGQGHRKKLTKRPASLLWKHFDYKYSRLLVPYSLQTRLYQQ